MLLANQSVKGKFKRKMKHTLRKTKIITKHMKCTKAVLREKFRAINATIKKKERSQIIKLHLQELEKKLRPKL